MSAASTAPSPRFRTWLRRFAIVCAVVVALIAIVWLAVPPIARSQLESRLTEALGRKTTVEAVEFNPFTLRLTVRNAVVADPGKPAPLFACNEIVADLSSASIWHRAPVLDALRLARPSMSLARDGNGRYSVQDLIDKAQAAPPGPTPEFSLNNIEIEDGSIAFDDGVTSTQHALQGLQVGIPFLSSLPYQTDIRVLPLLRGTFDGSVFALGGSTVPFAQPREAALDINLEGLPLKDYVVYLPARPRLDLRDGKLTTRLTVAFVEGKPEQRKLEVRGDARLDGLALARRDGSAVAGIERIAVVLDRIDVLGRDVRIASVEATAPSLDLRRTGDGKLELAAPLFEGGPAPAATTEAPWTFTVAKASIAGGAVEFSDEASAFKTSLADVTADATNLSNRAGEKARVTLAFVTKDRHATFKGEADVEPLAPAVSGKFELTKFSLASLFPYYKEALAVDVQQGALDFATQFSLDRDGKFRLTQGTGGITTLALAYPGERAPFWQVPAIAAEGVDVDVDTRSVKIASLASRNTQMRLVRERDGTIDWARLLKTTKTTGTAQDERTWTLALAKLAVNGASLDVEDKMAQPAVKVAVRDINVTASDVSNARGAKATVALKAQVGQRGRVAYDGALATNPFAMAGRVDASGLDLVPLRPYIESQVDVSVTAGTVAAKGNVSFEPPGKVAWKGNVTVANFAALDKPTASDLARWKTLALDDMDVVSEPLRVTVGRIGVEDYYARVIVYQDGALNYTRLLKPKAEAKPEPPRSEPLPVTLGRIELARGNVNFSDFFVRPNYTANLTDVTGSVTTMSAEKAGDVAIAARIDKTAPVEVSGRIHPFAKTLSLDIAAKARDVDLPPLTPYSVKYAGYGIEKGKLSFDVHYVVENRKLSADNRLVLDQLTFNPQRVDSETATKLPVLLAVSLLKDSKGVIDIELPISGSLDDPQFSVGGLIVRVIVNLLTKAVTAPFALLSAAFGKGEELSVVPFAPGSAALDDEARKRIDTLGKALADRPALKLDIAGRADGTADREALRQASVDTAMKREKMKSLATQGNAPASAAEVQIGADERTRWLTAAYRESSIKDRPRNAVGMLAEVPPAQMEAMLLADAKVGDEDLRLLANARGQSVKDALMAKSIDGERLFLIVPRAAADTPNAPPTRVDLALR